CVPMAVTVNLFEMKVGLFLVVLLAGWGPLEVTAQRTTPSARRSVTIVAQPNAVVWIDEIRRGVTDAAGRVAELKITSGAHTLRVRADGFRQVFMSIAATQRGEIKINLVRTTDQGELLFQRAETARETARD